MPRLINSTYLKHRQFLITVFQDVPGLYLSLAPAQQWDLQGFFQLASSDSDDLVLQARRAITKTDRSLAHRAGRIVKQVRLAYEAAAVEANGNQAAFNRVITRQAGVPVSAQQDGNRIIYVRGEVNPVIDTTRLARVLIRAMKERGSERPDG